MTEFDFRKTIEGLTGQRAGNGTLPAAVATLGKGTVLGYSQFNELLLILGYDRICPELFQFLADGSTQYWSGVSIKSAEDLEAGVVRFRTLALLLFGNVKFAFKRLAANPEELEAWISTLDARDAKTYMDRHLPIQPIEPIEPSDTYLLGYMVEAEIENRLKERPADPDALALKARRASTLDRGRRNQSAYLVSDHLDVYVATSMRERHEFIAVNELCTAVFGHPTLSKLKVRWFDPTQAYCADRVDKGLAEALMLKRAKCTLYLVQETDTLGKDSELASTLAQGKPVIAYVPRPGEDFIDRLMEKIRSTSPGVADEVLLLQQLRIFDCSAAWLDRTVQRWLFDPDRARAEVDDIKRRLAATVRTHYDRRAKMLVEQHPLGIQVNLATGVANGVLVVRNENDCAELISRIMTATLEFDVQDTVLSGVPYVYLRERITQCIFRVMTGDQELTNAFWNFYLRPST